MISWRTRLGTLLAGQFHRPSPVDLGLPATILTVGFTPGTNPNPTNPARHLHAGSPGWCEWASYTGWSQSCLSEKMGEKARTSSNKTTASEVQQSLHAQPTTPFPSGCSPPMRIQDDWCRNIKVSLRPRAWLGLRRFTLNRLARGGLLLK